MAADHEARIVELERAMQSVIDGITRVAQQGQKITESIDRVPELFNRVVVGEEEAVEVYPMTETLVWLRGEVTELRLQLDSL